MKAKQRGGTILGFIAGVLVGLGAAMVVAVYVTKVPVPFVNKNQQRSAEQDAAEARKNKDWDPNAPLQGKTPARSATAPVADEEGRRSPAPAASPVPTVRAGKPETRSEPKPEGKSDGKTVSSDPLGDLARARTGATSPAATASAATVVDPFIYFVQAGAFRTPEDAEAQRARLGLAGVDAKVSEREQSGRTVYRVRVGPFERKADADRAKDKIEGASMDAVLVRVQR